MWALAQASMSVRALAQLRGSAAQLSNPLVPVPVLARVRAHTRLFLAQTAWMRPCPALVLMAAAPWTVPAQALVSVLALAALFLILLTATPWQC